MVCRWIVKLRHLSCITRFTCNFLASPVVVSTTIAYLVFLNWTDYQLADAIALLR